MALLTSIPFTGTSEDNLKRPEKMRAPCPMIPNEKKREREDTEIPSHATPRPLLCCSCQRSSRPAIYTSCHVCPHQTGRRSPAVNTHGEGELAEVPYHACCVSMCVFVEGGGISQLTSCCPVMFRLHADHLLRGPGLPGPPL